MVAIDETLARQFFPDEDPIGRHLQVPDGTRPPREIVGVVGAVHDTGFDQQPRPTIYLPSLQSPDQTMSLVVRTNLPTGTILPAIKNAVWSVDKDQPVFSVRTMDEIVSGIVSAQRIAFILLAAFAVLALVLAAIGIYGVTSVCDPPKDAGDRDPHGVGRATGRRLAPGLGEGIRLVGIGTAVGAVAALALTRLMSALLFGVSASDPLTFAAVAVLMGSVALVSVLHPRAARDEGGSHGRLEARVVRALSNGRGGTADSRRTPSRSMSR